MKKIIYITIIILLLITNTSCTNKRKENNMNTKNSLVLYFSATGTTKQVAIKIAETINSDIIEIIPQEPYTPNDLDYNNDNSRANKEQNDPNSRPKIKNEINIDNYDTIYLGYPIWWGTIPKIILTFIDTYNLENKTIIPFCTSGSTEITQSITDLKNYNNKINWQNGKRFTSDITKEEIQKWLQQ